MKQEFRITYGTYRSLPYFLLGWTAFVAVLSILIDTDNHLGLKVVLIFLTVLIWCASLIFAIPILIKWFRRKAWINETVKERHKRNAEFTFAFDGEKLYFTTDTFRTELIWEHYKYWCENKGSIFIFPETNVYDAIYYSKTELGEENYDRLREFAKNKLISLRNHA